MPRSCSSNSETRLYDVEANISDLEKTIYKVMFVCGIGHLSINSVTIDEIVDAIRATFPVNPSSNVGTDSVMQLPKSANPGYEFLNKNHAILIRELRWAWFDYQIAKYERNK